MNRPKTSGGAGAARAAVGPALALPASLVVLFATVIPALLLFRYSFNHYDPALLMRTAFTFENYVKFVKDPYFFAVLWSTVWMSFVCTLFSLVLGFPLAWALARTQSRFKSLLVTGLVFPMLVGGVVQMVGWMVILGNAGVVNSVLVALHLADRPLRLLYTPLAVMLGLTAYVLPYMVLTLQGVLEGIDFSIEEAARNLGAGPLRTFVRIVVPVAAPGVAAGAMLVFILCMNGYVTPVLLGGTGITMMAPTVYDQISHVSNWPFGAALALVLMVTTLALALGSNFLIHRNYAKTMAS
ncbi:ABC transporter permease [Burkholderia sp. WAC0059]|uniref:ABC transporter permease n=1 Tax=Burkholderia sp. WAC0059 TaxID=2066022 RepID=UPI000C7EC0E6|nr:ABC transporter permease [Burkholderia sp. WAC0059]PLZ02378.1 ABC transporter permease [Burkholderia sp. WAC0059]